MHSRDENTLFHDGVIPLQILLTPGPYKCNLWKIAWLLSFIASQLQRITEPYFILQWWNLHFLQPSFQEGHQKFL